MQRATGCRWHTTKNRCSRCTSWLLRPRVCIPNIFRWSATPWEPTCLPWPHLCARAGSSYPKPLVLVSRWMRRLCSAIAWIARNLHQVVLGARLLKWSYQQPQEPTDESEQILQEGDSVAKLTISAAARTWCVACSALLPRSSYATTETATHGATGPVRPHPHSQPRIYRVSHPPARESSSGARMGLYPALAAHRGLSRPAAHGHGSLARGEPSWGDAAHD